MASRRIAWVLAPFALVLAGAGPFDGCGGPGTSPTPLPRDESGACFFDTDCVPTGCEDLACVAGVCTRVADIRDADGDGQAPPPCGDDCDDLSASIRPGQTEICDLVDQDCDGNVDEMAMPTAIQRTITTSDSTMAMVLWGDALLVTDATFSTTGVRVRPLGVDGTLDVTQRLLESGTTVLAADAVATAEGATFALALEDPSTTEQSIAIVPAVRLADGRVEPQPPIVHAASGISGYVSMVAVGDTIVVAWDEGSLRRMWSPSWTAVVDVADGLVEGIGALDLATDGTHVVVASSLHTLAFYDAADGALAGSQETSGNLVIGRPLASDGAGIAAVVADAGGDSIQTITLAAVGALTALPTGGSTIRIEVVPAGYLLLRTGPEGTRAWVLDHADPFRAIQTFGPTELGSSATGVVDVEVASPPAGPVILTNYGTGGASVALIACPSGG